MTRATIWMIIAVGFALIAGGLLIILAVGLHRHRAIGPDHPGAQLNTPTLPPPPADQRPKRYLHRPEPRPAPGPSLTTPTGRHHADTVRPVPADWRPPAKKQRPQGWDDTHVMRPIRDDDRP